MDKNIINSITSDIINLQDTKNCWNVLAPGDKYYPELKHYSPLYNSTLWVLILLADIKCDPGNSRLRKPLEIISEHFIDRKTRIYSIGKSHFPIPCLNGNMLYLHQYFKYDPLNISGSIVDFFSKYQRFDDGDFHTPKDFPYFSNRSCYGKHTCYWGVTKLFKGLSFIPEHQRSENAKSLLKKCINFILLHEVCYSSHNKNSYIHTNIRKLTFPNMYQSDYLEILWLLKREGIKSPHLTRALNLLKSKMKPDSTWNQERVIKDLIIPVNKNHFGSQMITERAREVIDYN